MWSRLKTFLWKLVSWVPRLRVLVPQGMVLQRAAMCGCGILLVVLGFFWGRSGVNAQQGRGGFDSGATVASRSTDYSRRPVAYIYNGHAITREDLGEYLIARFGPERVDFLVNRRIIEVACEHAGVSVTDAEVEAQLVDDLRVMNIPRLEDFVNHVLKKFNKTLYEYKEDVIRPKLALAKFCRQKVTVDANDLQMAFEAKYGPKVECRMIVLPQEMSRQAQEIWEKVSKSDTEFNDYARKQPIQALASKGGEMPPIHKHFGDQRIEQEAFSLKPGDVSKVMEMPDKTLVILKCVRHLPPDSNRQFNQERVALHNEVFEIKLAREIPRAFQEMRVKADPKIILKRDNASLESDRKINGMLNPRTPGAPPVATAQAPTPPPTPSAPIEVPPAPPVKEPSATPSTAEATSSITPRSILEGVQNASTTPVVPPPSEKKE